MQGNAFVGILLGGSTQELMGMIRALTAFINVSLLNVPLPPKLLFFIKVMSVVSELDLFQGPSRYEAVFKFRETSAFNPQFKQFGITDMNFMMNSASIPICFCLAVFFAILWLVLAFCAKCFYRNSCCRRIGMHATS